MKKKSIPTLIAISILAWILANIFHEILGHAGMGLLSGFNLRAVNTTTAYFDVNWNDEIAQNGLFSYRLFLFGGVLLNVITGLIALLILKRKNQLSSHMRLFLWLFASFSWIIVVMNLVTAPITGGGDFAGIIKSFDNQNPVQIIVLLIGLLTMVFGYMLLQKSFMPIVKGYRKVTLMLTVIPVVTVIITQSLSILQSPFATLPPAQNHLLASVFAFFHFIIWAIIVNMIPSPGKTNSLEKVIPGRSISWMIIGGLALIFFVFFLGPGLGSFEGHPSLGN